MKYLVVIEKTKNNYSAYIPDLPGCVAMGKTIREVKKLIRESVKIHIAGMREDTEPLPIPSTLRGSSSFYSKTEDYIDKFFVVI